MSVLLPALNAPSAEAFREQARVVRSFSPPWVQIDVADGILGTPKNFADPLLVQRELSGVRIDVHLMVREVGPAVLEPWLGIAPARLTLHVEAGGDLRQPLSEIRRAGSERGLALGPDTPVERILPYLDVIDLLLFVGVPPGRSGQRFDPNTLVRIRAVRERSSELAIGVDGGVTAELVPALKSAGATVIAVASALFSAPDPAAAYRALKQLAEA